jgi:HSP20 family protein
MATDERKDFPQERSREDWSFWHDPFSSVWRADSFRRWANEMDRWFHDAGHGGSTATVGRVLNWTPDIETFQRGDQFVVRADLPGMKRDDIAVQVADDSLTIEGDRRSEHEEEREGLYRTERRCGTFCRVIPLPEGTLADSAQATFHDGVLEIVMQAPPKEVGRGRRLEISDADPATLPSQTSDRRDIVASQAPAAPGGTGDATIFPE